MSVVGSYEGVIGVDVGGTRIKAALVDDAGRILARAGCPTPDRSDPEAVLSAVAEIVEALRQDEQIGGLGVAVPGIIDEPRGVAVLAANLGWRDTPVRDLLAARTGLPVTLGHDVRSACLAEWQVGAGRRSSDLLLVTLGTGIGAGVVADGRLLRGGGYAGQLGHVVVDPDGDACGCGQRGCLATVASATSLVRRYQERTLTADLSAAAVMRRAAAGDPAAVAVVADATHALAGALASAVTVFGSDTVVVGGGLALAGEQLLAPVRAALRESLTFQRKPTVVAAELGDESGVVGAALLARTWPDTAQP
ncbi:ROK family protein [Actinopolymorpha sp. B17G11]|uniref:ROK family protein n=1 Tax=Actinopolymorpha sp. B17G11 TaxID=3160861 RepID=UPI0032E3FA15